MAAGSGRRGGQLWSVSICNEQQDHWCPFVTITTLDRKARLPVLPQSHQMRKWSDVKKSYSFAEALSADQLIGKARAKTVLLIQITDIDLKTLFIKHGSKK